MRDPDERTGRAWWDAYYESSPTPICEPGELPTVVKIMEQIMDDIRNNAKASLNQEPPCPPPS